MSTSEKLSSTPCEPYDLPTATLADIAKIVLEAARISDMLSQVSFKIAHVEPDDGYLLLGDVSLPEKIRRLEHFMKKYGDVKDVTKLRDLCRPLQLVFAARNSIAHGVYIGRDPHQGVLLFAMPSNNLEPQQGVTRPRVDRHSEKQLSGKAKYATNTARRIEKLLNAVSVPDAVKKTA